VRASPPDEDLHRALNGGVKVGSSRMALIKVGGANRDVIGRV